MATNSTIAIQTEDGTVFQIFCHWDGQLSHNGKLLMDHYPDVVSIEDLISKGNLSSLESTVEESEFRCRDLGDSWYTNKPNEFSQLQSYYQFLKLNAQQFNYLFKDGEWLVSEGKTSFYRLDDALLFDLA